MTVGATTHVKYAHHINAVSTPHPRRFKPRPCVSSPSVPCPRRVHAATIPRPHRVRSMSVPCLRRTKPCLREPCPNRVCASSMLCPCCVHVHACAVPAPCPPNGVRAGVHAVSVLCPVLLLVFCQLTSPLRPGLCCPLSRPHPVLCLCAFCASTLRLCCDSQCARQQPRRIFKAVASRSCSKRHDYMLKDRGTREGIWERSGE